MTVLYLYDNYPLYRKDFFELLNQKLTAAGNSFAFYYGTKKENASRQEVTSTFPIKSFPIMEMKIGSVSLMYYREFRKAFKDIQPDIVVLQFHVAVLSYWWAYLYMKRHDIPYIIWDCNYTRDSLGSYTKSFRKKLVDFTYRKATACITYGSVFKKYLLGIGRSEKDVFVAQNTINIESIIKKQTATCEARTFNHPIRILYVGALLDRKYVDSAIRAVSQLIRNGYDIYFDIVGDGPERNKMAVIIQENNVGNRIILHGAKHGEDVNYFFINDDVFLLPGTGGLAINEAMSYAMPIISTYGDDTVVDLIDGNGILLNNFGDQLEIEKALKRFLDMSEIEKVTMSQKSLQIIKERATLENMVNQHIKAIEHVSKSITV